MNTQSRFSLRPALLIVSLCLASAPLSAARGEDAPPAGDKPDVEVQKDLPYGSADGEKLLLDLAMPKQLDHAVPGIVWIHGGGWQGGSKAEFEGAIRQTAQRGMVAISINYRLVPKHVFPAQIEDCKCAVRWLRANAAKYHVDPERIGVVGSSAGAHLAMLLGAMDAADGLEGSGGWSDTSSRVQAVVSYAGPTDALAELPNVSKPIVAALLGGPVSEKQDEARRASPITYVSSNDPPMLLVQGTKDPLVPYQQAYEMADALTKAGVPGRVELLLGEGHGWAKQHERVMRATFEFLDRQLAPRGDAAQQ